MNGKLAFGLAVLVTLSSGGIAAAQQPREEVLRGRIEALTALLDSHARRLYYEVRDEGDADDEELLSQVRELWNAARKASNRAMDGESAERLEREIGRVEKAFHRVEEGMERHHEWAEGQPHRMRMARLDRLVHDAHDRIHELESLETAYHHGREVPYRTDGSRVVDGSRAAEVERRAAEAARRAANDELPPALQVGPDGLYFDPRRLPNPFGR